MIQWQRVCLSMQEPQETWVWSLVRNGNQYSCWDNLMDTGAWKATALGVTDNQTLLNNWASMQTDNQLNCNWLPDTYQSHWKIIPTAVSFNIIYSFLKSWLIGKDPDAGRVWGQEEKGTTDDEMAGWHYRLDGHESE